MPRLHAHQSTLPLWPLLTRLILGLLFVVCLTACTSRHKAAENTLPRAAPGHLQWLERQSLLGAAPELTAQVSGTELLWRNSAGKARPHVLLEAAPNWLYLDPHSMATGQALFRALQTSPLSGKLTELGVSGLFLAPTGERGDIWTQHTGAQIPLADSPMPDNGNVVSLRFDPALGSETDFTALAQKLEGSGIQLGGELPPAATGLGPDFMLQARRAPRFDGIYAMLPVPRTLWDSLPRLGGELDCLPLRPAAVARLQESALLPPALERDSLPWATPGGWAVTGEVRGADGQPRRWVYRHAGDHLRPVLLWQDPSGKARHIFSAAVIQHVGLQRQSLAGLRFEALLGMEAAEPRQKDKPAPISLSPGLEALTAVAGEVRRYGGWSMQDDVLPASLTPAILASHVDFARDAASSAGAALALLSGDATPLRHLLDAMRQIDQQRMARGLDDWRGVDWRPLLDLPDGRALAALAQQKAGQTTDHLQLAASPAAIAALALNPDIPSSPASDLAPDRALARPLRPGRIRALRQGCHLLLGLRLALPGLAFVSVQELTGAFWLPHTPASPPGLTPLWDARIGHGGTTTVLPLAFGPLAEQWADKDSFAHEVARLLRARQQYGLGLGSLEGVSGSAGTLATLCKLPGGGWWIWAANFSSRPQDLPCLLPAPATHGPARDLLSGSALPLAENGRMLRLHLAPRQARHLLLGVPSHPKPEGAHP